LQTHNSWLLDWLISTLDLYREFLERENFLNAALN